MELARILFYPPSVLEKKNKMVQIFVNFTNNPHGVYYSGQNLSGEIEINNEKTRKIRCITMEIEGFAEVKFILKILMINQLDNC